jgi:hypothetical protein
VFEPGRVGQQHLRHAGDARRRVGRGARLPAGDQHTHLAAKLPGRRDGVQRRGLQRRVVVFRDDERRHGSCSLQDLRFVAQLVDERVHVGHLDARAALRRLGQAQCAGAASPPRQVRRA